MQMGCIMRPKVLQVVLCEGAARMYVQHHNSKFNIKFAYLKKNLYLCTLNV